MQNLSILEPFGEQWSSCGYCKADGDTSPKFYCRSSRMRCVDYQDLVFRGWRRSGKIFYHPINSKSCCPNYTIRLDVSQFQASKHQNRVAKRVNRHLRGLRPAPGKSTTSNSEGTSEGDRAKKQKTFTDSFTKLQAELREIAQRTALDKYLPDNSDALPLDRIQMKVMGKKNADTCSSEGSCKLSCNIALLTHAIIRKTGKNSEEVSSPDCIADTLATSMNEAVQHLSERDKVKSIYASGKGFITLELNITKDSVYQSLSSPSERSTHCIEDSEGNQHELRVEMVKAQYEEESYQLFRKYQMEIHKEGPEEVTAKGYKRFLVESPLINESFNEELQEVPLGNTRGEGANTAILEVLENKFLQLGVPRNAIRCCALMLDGALQTVGAVLDELAKEETDTIRSVLLEVFGEIPSECEEDIPASEFYPKLDLQQRKLERFLSGKLAQVRSALERAKNVQGQTTLDGISGFSSDTRTASVDKQLIEENLQLGMGTFHQKYYYDGLLVAVAVVDILPSCLSSVYLFYDPDYYWLELGKYSALREIQWVQQASTYRPHLHYYCMGYYIHSCQKMRYKGEYHPSELLCPETHKWVPINHVKPKLDRHTYCRFAENDIDDEEARQTLPVARVLPFFLELRTLSPLVAPLLTKEGQDIVMKELSALYRYAPEVAVRVIVKFN